MLVPIYKTTQNNIPEDCNFNIIMLLKKIDWIPWTQDRDPWQDLINTVMNLQFHRRQEIY
jgi:hypothetical protein